MVCDVDRIDIVGRQVSGPPCNESVAGEINQHAVVFLGHRRKPDFEFLLQIRERRLRADQPMNVFGAEIAAFWIDEDRVDRIRIALGKIELRLGGKIFIFRDADDQRVSARNRYTRRMRGRFSSYFRSRDFCWAAAARREHRRQRELSDAPDVIHRPPVRSTARVRTAPSRRFPE